jgi:trehalose 6-phosphate phosphatase
MGGHGGVSTTAAILERPNTGVLAGFALSNVLLAFDYDGTLAPIAPTPAQARMRAATRRLLARAATLYPCVVISGRSLQDVARRLTGIPVWHVFGNHGLESSSRSRRPAAQTRLWLARLTSALAGHAGVVVEDKGLTVTVHYRNAADRPAAVAAIEAAVVGLPAARVVAGSEAVNLLPLGGEDKGDAVRDALRLFACQSAIYVGDDATDEAAFTALGAQELLAIRVGAAPRSAARYYLESQAEIDRLLQALIDLRASGGA